MAPSAGRGVQPAQIRAYHQRLVLQRLRRLGAASKAEIAREINLSGAGVGQIVRELEELGLVRFSGRRTEGRRGQPADLLELDPGGAYGIGVRLDRNGIETMLVDLAGKPLGYHSHAGPLPSPKAALKLIRADVSKLRQTLRLHERRRITGIGLARPFNLGAWLTQLDLRDAALAAWDDTDFAQDLGTATGLATAEENDGSAAAIAELLYGHGRGADHFLYLFLGSAIGGGVITAGTPMLGPTGNAGDVAVMPVGPSRLASAPPPAQDPEILLTRASVNALVRHLRFRRGGAIKPGDLIGAMTNDPAGVDEWLDDCTDALVGPILSAAALLDLPLVVIDSDLAPTYVGRLVERLRPALAAAVAEARQPPQLAVGSFGAKAGAIGAASLPLFLHLGLPAGPHEHTGNLNAANARL